MPRKHQPTATAFVRKQESFGQFILDKVRDKIDAQEAVEDLNNPSDALLDLYDDEMFWARYVQHMKAQREHLRSVYDIN